LPDPRRGVLKSRYDLRLSVDEPRGGTFALSESGTGREQDEHADARARRSDAK
jgi:hypothetical protein